MKLITPKITLILLGTVVSGCSGYDRALLATKTNVGLDIDSNPPTAEITIARRELAILPTFPGAFDNVSTEQNSTKTNNSRITEQNVTDKTKSSEKETSVKESTLPVLALFGLEGGFFNPKITGHFAGGDAAVYLAGEDSKKEVNSSLCLATQKQIDTKSPLLKFWHWITFKSESDALQQARTEARPFYFATDTAFGVKVAWSGTAGPYPDSLKMGYNRKEFASPPIFVERGCSGKTETDLKTTTSTTENTPNGGTVEKWSVKLPSFYASIQNELNFNSFFESRINHRQFFATGQAATAIAKRASIRQVPFENMAPNAAYIEAKNLNQDLIREINEVFEADKSKQSEILNESIRLELVAKETSTDSFKNALNKNVKKANYLISTKLNELRVFAQKLNIK
jgi:hypothetical protein